MDIWDGAWKLMEHDPASGRCVWMTIEDGQYVFRVDQPLDAIFTANREAEIATQGQRFGDWNRIGSVPLHLAYQNGLDDAIEQQDQAFVSRFFNDSDNKKFRTSRGKV